MNESIFIKIKYDLNVFIDLEVFKPKYNQIHLDYNNYMNQTDLNQNGNT